MELQVSENKNLLELVQDLDVRQCFATKETEVLLDEMTSLANGLLIQQKVMRAFKIFSRLCGEGRSINIIHSIEGLCEIFKHRKLFLNILGSDLIAVNSNQQIKINTGDNRSSILDYPHIDELYTSWMRHEADDLRNLGLKIKKIVEKEKNSALDKIKVEKVITKLKTGKYRFVHTLFDSENKLVQRSMSFLADILKTFDLVEFDENNFDLEAFNSLLIPELNTIISCYDEQEDVLSSLYSKLRTQSALLINKERDDQKKKTLRLNYNVIYRSQNVGNNGVRIDHLNLLPNIFPTLNISEKIEEVAIDKQEDDWLPQHLKKTMRPKTAPKGKAKKSPKKGMPKKVRIIKERIKNAENEIKASAEQKEKNQLITAQDGSYLLEETDDYLEFADPKNDLTTRILKTDQSEKSVTWSEEQLAQITQTDWIKKWYEDPNQALQDQNYMDPTSKKFTHPDNYRKTIAYHTPGLILNSYMKRLAQQGEIASRKTEGQIDTVFTMPGVQFYKEKLRDGKSWKAGIFAWLIDGSDKKTNYHIEFRPTEITKMANDWIAKGYLEVNFPSLDEEAQYNKK